MKFFSRKFIFSILALLMATWLVYLGKITGDAYTQVIAFLSGFYVASNTVEHISETMRTISPIQNETDKSNKQGSGLNDSEGV